VLLCTLEDENNRAYGPGAADFLTKPIDWSRLSSVLRRFRAGKPAARVLIIDDDARTASCWPAWWSTRAGPAPRRRTAACRSSASPRKPPDLILLDLMMPEMDGFDLVRIIRKTQAGRSIPS